MSPNWSGGWESVNEPTIRDRLGEWARDRDVDWWPVVRLVVVSVLVGFAVGFAAGMVLR